MRWETCNSNSNNNATGSLRSSLWKQTAAGYRCMHYKKDRLVLAPPVRDIVESTVSISSLSSGDTGKYSVRSGMPQRSHQRSFASRQSRAVRSNNIHRKPPIPEEEASPVLERRHQRPTMLMSKRQGRAFYSRDIMRLVDQESIIGEDEVSLCSRDLEIMSAASSKAVASVAESSPQFDLQTCLSENSSGSCIGGRSMREQQENGGDPPGIMGETADPGESLLNIDRILAGESPTGNDDLIHTESSADTAENVELNPGTTYPIPFDVLEISPPSKDRKRELESENRARKKEGTAATQSEEPVARLNIGKMESTNQRASATLPVVCAQSLASTQVKRLDWTTVTKGKRVFEREKDAESSVPFDERRARKLLEMSQKQNEVVAVVEEEQDREEEEDVEEEQEREEEEKQEREEDQKEVVAILADEVSVSCSNESGSCEELKYVSSKDPTEKAGTARKKLIDLKHIGARTTAKSKLDEIHRFCGIRFCAILLCE